MIGFLEAEKTPQKRKFKPTKGHGHGHGASKKTRQIEEDDAPIHLPRGVKYLKRADVESLKVYDDSADCMTDMPVLCLHENLKPTALPVTDLRPANKKHLVGLAAQTFNVSEVSNFSSAWLSGFVDLQPGCLKDPEAVGDCAQVFFVSECQDGACKS